MMSSFPSVLHIPRSADAYAVNRNTLHLRLRTVAGEVGRVFLTFGDPFIWEQRREAEMQRTFSSWNHDWFEIDISLPHSRYAYYFVVETPQGAFQYGEFGLSETINPGNYGKRCFHYQHLSESEIFQPPAWVANSVFYLVFPDRFRRDAWDEDPASISDEDTGAKGGTLRGVIESINYLKELGISALYFTPIFKAQSYHRYDTTDYYAIDPLLGTEADFRELVQTAHDAGIRIILDGVFNHCGSQFPPFQDLVKKREASQYRDWFYAHTFPINLERKTRLIKEEGWSSWFEHEDGARSLEYETFAFTPFMPRLRTSNPEVQQYFLDVALHWIREYDIDGWRLDVADEVSPDFWRAFRKAVKAEKPDAYIVGEVWYDSRFWLDGTQFDAVMNYPVSSACKEFFAERSISSEEMRSNLSEAVMRYSWPVNNAMMSLFESHDTDRFLSVADGDQTALILAYCFILMFPGAPLLLYGSEVGMSGNQPHGNRRPMNWDPASWNQDILSAVRTLTELRRKTPALRLGNFAWFNAGDDNIIAFIRSHEREQVFIFINRAQENRIASGPEGGRDLSTGKMLSAAIDVPAGGYRVIEYQKTR